MENLITFFKYGSFGFIFVAAFLSSIFMINKIDAKNIDDIQIVEEYAYKMGGYDVNKEAYRICFISDFKEEKYGENYLKGYNQLLIYYFQNKVYGYDLNDISFEKGTEKYLSHCQVISFLFDVTETKNNHLISDDLIKFVDENKEKIEFVFPSDLLIKEELKKKLMMYKNVNFVTLGDLTYDYSKNVFNVVPKVDEDKANTVLVELRNYKHEEFFKRYEPEELAVLLYSKYYLYEKNRKLSVNKQKYILDSNQKLSFYWF